MTSLAFGAVPIGDVTLGIKISYSQMITDADIKSFAGLSGDHNPVHINEEYEQESRYGRRIAHGLMSGSFFSALFGTRLPGPGCVYVSLSLQFKRPVYIDYTVTASREVTSVDLAKKRVLFKITCTVFNKVVISGEAEIFIPNDWKLDAELKC